MALTPEEQEELNSLNEQLGGGSSAGFLSPPPAMQTPSFGTSAMEGLTGLPLSDPDFQSKVVGASKGYLKNIGSAVTAPADLLYREGNKAIDWLTGVETNPADVTRFAPSNMVGTAVDALAGNTPSNPTAEAVGSGVGTMASFVGGFPTALPNVMTAAKTLPLVPKVLTVGGTGALEGALANTVLAAKDRTPTPEQALSTAAEGAVGGFVGAGAAPILSEVASDVAPIMGRAAQGWNESSLGGTVNSFLKSKKQGGMEYDPELARMKTPLSNSIESVRQEGTLPTFRNPASTSDAVSTMKEGIGQEIGGMIKQIDAAGIKPNLQLAEVDRFIAEAPFTLRADLRAQRDAFVETLRDWSGTAEELHWAKSSIGKIAYKSNGVDAKLNKGLQRAIERDLRGSLSNALQEGVSSGKLAPETVSQFTEANKRFSNYANVEEVVSDNAIRAQHQADKLGFAVRQIATTGGFGGLAYYGQQTDNPYLKYAGALGIAARTRAGQAAGAAIFRGGAQGADLISAIGENPYFAQGLMLAALPRTWADVKGDSSAKEIIAMNMGIDPAEYNSLPEPVQQEIHKQAVLMNPNGAEPSPDNLTLYNQEYVNPAEKDWVVKSKLDASPAERYKFIGSSWQNKHPGEAGWAAPIAKQAPVAPPLSQINSMLGSVTPTPVPTANQEIDDMVSQMFRATELHRLDDEGYTQ